MEDEREISSLLDINWRTGNCPKNSDKKLERLKPNYGVPTNDEVVNKSTGVIRNISPWFCSISIVRYGLLLSFI